MGVVEVKQLQWYQCEIDHLSVHPAECGKGIAKKLLQKAEAKAKKLGARVTQCTIRVGNNPSEGLFKKLGYAATVTFLNQKSGNHVSVYQKVLVPIPKGTANPVDAPYPRPRLGF